MNFDQNLTNLIRFKNIILNDSNIYIFSQLSVYRTACYIKIRKEIKRKKNLILNTKSHRFCIRIRQL